MRDSKEYWKRYYETNKGRLKKSRKLYYETHKEERKKKSREYNRTKKGKECMLRAKIKRRSSNRSFIEQYLIDHPCVDCGLNDVIVLQFDHVKGKKYSVTGIASTMSLRSLKKEISKCEVRCANCHVRRHRLDKKKPTDLILY